MQKKGNRDKERFKGMQNGSTVVTTHLDRSNIIRNSISNSWVYSVFCNVTFDPEVVIIGRIRPQWPSLQLHLVSGLPSPAYDLQKRIYVRQQRSCP